MNVCLDSWAVIAWLDGKEPALGRLDGLVDHRPVMSWINLAEVYYRVDRDQGREHADAIVRRLRAAFHLDLPNLARMIEAARLSSAHPMALGDCFAVATAAAHGLPLLTGDPEIITQAGLPCVVEDLRPAPG